MNNQRINPDKPIPWIPVSNPSSARQTPVRRTYKKQIDYSAGYTITAAGRAALQAAKAAAKNDQIA